MKQKLIVLTMIVLSFALAACGANPVEQIEETASEQIAETIAEQVTGLEDIEINEEDGSASYSVTDEDGNETSMSVETGSDIDAISGMGVNIPLPKGLVNGALQETKENGETVMISGSFEAENLSSEDFFQSMHDSLTAAGFVYGYDAAATNSGQPDPATAALEVYTHPNGLSFSILWSEGGATLGLVKVDAPASGSADADIAANETESVEVTVEETAVDAAPAALDGTMTLNKDTYGLNEEIIVTLALNSTLPDDAWVGIVPSDVPHGSEAENDEYDVAYAYISNAENGSITLIAPYDAGNYDIRLFDTDAEGVELASVSITVAE